MSTSICLVGCGVVGRSWAVLWLQAAPARFAVSMYDPDEAQLETAKRELHKLDADCFSRVRFTSQLQDALRGCRWVQECVPENLNLKRRVFQELSLALTSLDPSVSVDTSPVLASSSSNLPISSIVKDLPSEHRQLCLVVHPTNPPHAIPLVELVPGPDTHSEAVQRAKNMMLGIGQQPVLVRKEVDGFLVNRLQYALLAEAFRLVEDGVASARDIDAVIESGLALRWSFMGPFETIDLNAPGGIQDYCDRYLPSVQRVVATQDNTRICSAATVSRVHDEMRSKYPLDTHNDRIQRRNRRLLELRRHKAEMEKHQ